MRDAATRPYSVPQVIALLGVVSLRLRAASRRWEAPRSVYADGQDSER